jgi:hypothetical protein
MQHRCTALHGPNVKQSCRFHTYPCNPDMPQYSANICTSIFCKFITPPRVGCRFDRSSQISSQSASGASRNDFSTIKTDASSAPEGISGKLSEIFRCKQGIPSFAFLGFRFPLHTQYMFACFLKASDHVNILGVRCCCG